ncbi:hypothetical protein ACKLTP_18860, partial [Paenarthrobacter ureafaciens]
RRDNRELVMVDPDNDIVHRPHADPLSERHFKARRRNEPVVKKSVSADRGVLLSEMQVSTGMKVFRAFNLLFLILMVFLTAYPFLNIIAQSLEQAVVREIGEEVG